MRRFLAILSVFTITAFWGLAQAAWLHDGAVPPRGVDLAGDSVIE